MENSKIFGFILIVLSIFILIITLIISEATEYIHNITGENMPFLVFVGIGVIFIYGLYTLVKKE